MPSTVLRAWGVPDGAAALTTEQQAAFGNGSLYFNAHTAANPNGAIRGQLDAPGTLRFASLDGVQETPSNTSGALGAGVLSVDEATGEVRGFVMTQGLVDVTMAHVHLAARGTPGDVIVSMVGGPDVWIVPDDAPPLTPAQIAAFVSGQLYFNVHTAAFPDGQIRGQLDKAGQPRIAALDGAQETPAVASSAFGSGVLAVDEGSGQVSGFLITCGMSPSVAHVHMGARGTPGGVILPLAGLVDLWVVPDAAPPLTQDLRTAFANGQLYFNAHTVQHPDGEIRGQLDLPGTMRMTQLDGGQETPPVDTGAFGFGYLSMDGVSARVRGFILTAGLVDPNVAHVHLAPRGTPGDIILPLAP